MPISEYRRSRAEQELVPFYEQMGAAGVEDYWRRKNVETIDGNPTGMFEDI